MDSEDPSTDVNANFNDPYQRALVMIEGSELDTALQDSPVLTKAISMQAAFGCELKLLCCVEEHELTPALLTAFEERLDEISENASVSAGAITCEPDSAEAAISAAREFDADLIVKQVDEASPYYLGIADHSDWRLMRNDVASVWFVKQPGAAIDRVVAAVGHSSERSTRGHTYLDTQSYRVFEAARHAANGLDSTLNAVHVVESGDQELPAYDIAVHGNIMSFARADSGTGHTQQENAKANYHGRQLHAFAQHVDSHGNDLDVRAGTAEDVIADFSRETDADLLVLGARPMSRWERLRSAPVAEPVLAEAPCDVLAVCAS